MFRKFFQIFYGTYEILYLLYVSDLLLPTIRVITIRSNTLYYESQYLLSIITSMLH